MTSRPVRLLGAAAMTLGIPAGAAGAAETSESAPATTAELSASTPGTTLPAPPPSIELGAASWSAVYGFGGVWIQVDPPVDQLVKIDEASGEVAFGIDAGTGAAVGDDAMWVTVGGAETHKIDPMTGEVLLVVATPGAFYLTVGAGSVWVPSLDGITRIDPTTGEFAATIPLDAGVTDLAASDDAVWTTYDEDGTVTRIDPATNAVVTTIETGAGAHDLAIDEHGVWVTNYQANTVSRIDPSTNEFVATIEGVGSGVGISAGNGVVYVSTQDEGISRIDPTTNEATIVAPLDGWNYGVAYGSDELWVTNVADGVVYRLDDRLLETTE